MKISFKHTISCCLLTGMIFFSYGQTLPVLPAPLPPKAKTSTPVHVKNITPPVSPVKVTEKPVSIEKTAATETVKFLCDAPGILYIDAEKRGVLQPDIPLKLKLIKGEYMVQVKSTDNPADMLNERLLVDETGIEGIYELNLQAVIDQRLEDEETGREFMNNLFLPYKMGMNIDEVQNLLWPGYSHTNWYKIPVSTEYTGTEVRYLWKEINGIHFFEDALSDNLDKYIGRCTNTNSYICFLFENNMLFDIDIRLFNGCNRDELSDFISYTNFSEINASQFSAETEIGNVIVLTDESDAVDHIHYIKTDAPRPAGASW